MQSRFCEHFSSIQDSYCLRVTKTDAAHSPACRVFACLHHKLPKGETLNRKDASEGSPLKSCQYSGLIAERYVVTSEQHQEGC